MVLKVKLNLISTDYQIDCSGVGQYLLPRVVAISASNTELNSFVSRYEPPSSLGEALHDLQS